MKKQKFAIIDANAIIHRAYHALPPLVNKNGILVNAVYGFANILLKTLKDIKPDYIAVCFDVARKTFRNDIYVDYKAQRERGPQELYDQMDFIKQLIDAFNMKIFSKPGFEADDIIGTLVAKTSKKEKQLGSGFENVIVTGDLDALQLVGKNTKVYTLRKGVSDTLVYDIDEVKKKYGFGPEQVVDYKALRGDPSDNIPGVPGIGEKTATNLIIKFWSLEKLYKFIDDVKKLNQENRNLKLEDKGIKKGVYEKLVDNKKQAFMSKKLATIVPDVKIKFDLESCKIKPFDAPRIIELFQQWNFKSLISRIPQAEKVITNGQNSLFAVNSSVDALSSHEHKFEIRKGYNLIDDDKKLNIFLKQLSKQDEFAVDTETDGMNPFQSRSIGISFCWKAGEAYYLSLLTQSNPKIQDIRYKMQKSSKFQIPNSSLNQLKKILSDKSIKKIGHNIKFDLEVLERAGFKLNGIEFDTMIASYLLNPGTRQHGLDTLVFTELGYEMTPIESLLGPKGKSQSTMDQVDINRVADYSAEDADYTWRLYLKLKRQLEKNDLFKLMDKIETPLIAILASMEKNGVMVDSNFLAKMSKKLEDRILNIEFRVHKFAKIKFNLASPIQLKQVLFDRLKISTAGLAKTKTGVSTAAAELEKLKGVHPIINLISEYRELSKLKSTYTDALPEIINPETSRIHTSYNQTVTATGRLSSSNPNLQNIPIRTELGRKIRQAFVAPKGYRIVAIDYSQIELRIAAAMSGDRKMLSAFNKKEDIHTRTAAEVFELPVAKVTPDLRRRAKEVNFGILYGLGPRGLAQRAGTSYDEALAFIEKYFEVYHDLKEYLEETIALAHEMEYVETLFGRKRYLPEINAEHMGMRAQAERMAVNHPLQGTAADLMKLAMIAVDNLIKREFKSDQIKMVMQVHDELIFEIKAEKAIKIAEKIKQEMETVYKFKCPIVAEIGIGNNWGECK